MLQESIAEINEKCLKIARLSRKDTFGTFEANNSCSYHNMKLCQWWYHFLLIFYGMVCALDAWYTSFCVIISVLLFRFGSNVAHKYNHSVMNIAFSQAFSCNLSFFGRFFFVFVSIIFARKSVTSFESVRNKFNGLTL